VAVMKLSDNYDDFVQKLDSSPAGS
jgi:hypothetical protein